MDTGGTMTSAMMRHMACSISGIRNASLVLWTFLCIALSPAICSAAEPPRTPRQSPSWASTNSTNSHHIYDSENAKQYIVVAADATAAYAFYLPMTVRIWKEVAGYDAIVLLIGPEWRSQKVPHTRTVLSALAETSAMVHILDVPDGSYTLSTTAQVARLLAAMTLPLADEDFLLVVDVDIWPLDKQHFSPRQRRDFVHIFDAFCCGSKPVDWRGFKTRSDSVNPDTDSEWYRVYPAGSQLAVITFAVIDQNLAPLSMGKLGSSNRAELEFSGMYTYGQVEWELDQRLLGLAMKKRGGCPGKCYLVPHSSTSLLDRLNWPATSGDDADAGALSGFLLAHLPMPAASSDRTGSDAGYGADGWAKVSWLLKRMAAGDAEGGALVLQDTANKISAYREAFERKIVDEVSSVVVSLADASLAADAEELAGMLEAQYGRSVLMLLFASGLSLPQLQGLALHRNVILASIPEEIVADLPSILDLRLHALRESMTHPNLKGVRVKMFIAPTVRVCAGGLQAAVEVASQRPAGRFMLRHGTGCSQDVQGYREDGAAWRQISEALQRGQGILAGDGPGCVPVEGGGFELKDLSSATSSMAEGDAWGGAASGARCEGRMDAVTSPFAQKALVVLVEEGAGADEKGGTVGWGRVLIKSEATRCAFRRWTRESMGLADAVLVTGAGEEACGGDRRCGRGGEGKGVLRLRLSTGAGEEGRGPEAESESGVDGEVVVEGVEGEVLYGDAWVASRVCEQVEEAVREERGRRGVQREGTKERHGGNTSVGGTGPEVVVVTAAGRNYFGCLRNLVGSVQVWGEGRSLVVYDLGMSETQRRAVEGWAGVVVRDVTWGSYPPHVRQLGTYAWKIMIWEHATAAVALEVGEGGGMLWVDACSELRRPLGDDGGVAARLLAAGFFLTVGAEASPRNVERDSRLTNRQQVEKLLQFHNPSAADGAAARHGVGGSEGKYEFRGVHCLAGLVGLQVGSELADVFLKVLVRCALDADCIAPVGSSLSNHRYEQAALSVVAERLGMSCTDDPRFRAYLLNDGSPSHPLPADPLRPADVFVLARRRHPSKPFARSVRFDRQPQAA